MPPRRGAKADQNGTIFSPSEGQKAETDYVRKPKADERIYEPPDWALRYAAAWVDPAVKPREQDRCKAAGVSTVTVWRAKRDSRFVTWLETEVRRISSLEQGAIRRAILKMANDGNLEAALAWLDRFERLVADPRPRALRLTAEGADDIEGLLRRSLAIEDEIMRRLGELEEQDGN